VTAQEPRSGVHVEQFPVYRDVFAAITEGDNLGAAHLLRGLSLDQLAELAVICTDVRTMAQAETILRRWSEERAPTPPRMPS
jgi:hypothetical protein